MATPDPRFRIDAARTVYLIGEFNTDLLRGALPRITELRAEPDKPISLVINSPGGEIDCLDAIVSALAVKDFDGGSSRVVTSVAGEAASAAAMLLCLGDYAVATPSSTILFHGSRTAAYEITVEKSQRIATDLAQTNRRIASHIAQTMFPRVVHRFLRLKRQIEQAIKGSKLRVIHAYVALAGKKVESTRAEKIFETAFKRFDRIDQVGYAIRKLNLSKRSRQAVKDSQVISTLITKAVSIHAKDKNWVLDETAVRGIVADYLLLREYSFGEHNHALGFLIQSYGPDFLSARKFKTYQKLAEKSEKDAMLFLGKEVAREVTDFWYLTVCISRFCFSGENRFTAKEAYWLGMIDEIVGDDDAFGFRQLAESKDSKPPTAP